MNLLTPDQQESLEFYSNNEYQVRYFGLTYLQDREDRVLFNKGKNLIEKVLNYGN